MKLKEIYPMFPGPSQFQKYRLLKSKAQTKTSTLICRKRGRVII